MTINNMPNVRFQSKHAKIFFKVVAFFILISAVSYYLFLLFIDGFIPTLKLRLISDSVALVFAASIFAAWVCADAKPIRYNLALMIVTPFFGALLGNGFVYGPINYALHKLYATESEITERVVHSGSFGGRQCQRRAILENDESIWKRRICDISKEDEALLKGGGEVKITGEVSDYGIKVKKYSVTAAYSPAMTKPTLPPEINLQNASSIKLDEIVKANSKSLTKEAHR